MKPHSWWPLLVSLALVGVGWWLASRGQEHHRHGPDVQPGVFPPDEPYVPGLAPEDLPIAVTVSDFAHPLAVGAGDERSGVSVVPWDEVGIVLDDHHPLTRSVARALAEHLTGLIAAGGGASPVPAERAASWVVLLPPRDSAQLPFQMRRIIRVSTAAPTGLAFEDYDRSTPLAVETHVSLHDALLPSVRAHSGLAPAAGIRERGLRISAEVPAEPAAAWADWHIRVGRSLAAAALVELLADAPPGPAWYEPPDRSQAVIGRVASGVAGLTTWSETIPVPPHSEVDRWYGVFQTPLIRGWSGAIVGTEVPDLKGGGTEATIAVFSETVGDEKWHEPEVAADESEYLWKARDVGALDRLVASRRPWGWTITAYQINPQARQLMQAWIEALPTGNQLARIHLRQHLDGAWWDAELRERARSALAVDAQLADHCALGREAPAGSPARLVLGWCEWIRGLRVQPPSSPPPALDPAGGSILRREELSAVVLPDRHSEVSGWLRYREAPARRLTGVADLPPGLRPEAVTDTPAE